MSRPIRVHDHDRSRLSAGLFAATVVITIGLGACLVVALLTAPDEWWTPALVVAAAAALCFILWLFNESPMRKAKNTNFYRVRKELVDEYVQSFRPRYPRPQVREVGTNKPPSADDLRQIKEDSNAWYPSQRRTDEYRRNLGKNDA